MEKTFTKIYQKEIWGKERGSGAGSSVAYNKRYIAFLEDIINHPDNQIHHILDLGCGDWQFSQTLNFTGKYYLGVDCVKSVIDHHNSHFQVQNEENGLETRIQFLHQDFSQLNNVNNLINDPPEVWDLVILKDVLQHWSDQQITVWLDNFLKNTNFRFILITNGWKQTDVPRNVVNRYHYSKLNAEKYPLNKYHPEILFYYRYKQVSLIKAGNTPDLVTTHALENKEK